MPEEPSQRDFATYYLEVLHHAVGTEHQLLFLETPNLEYNLQHFQKSQIDIGVLIFVQFLPKQLQNFAVVDELAHVTFAANKAQVAQPHQTALLGLERLILGALQRQCGEHMVD